MTDTLRMVLVLCVGAGMLSAADAVEPTENERGPNALVAGRAAREDGLYSLAQKQLEAYLATEADRASRDEVHAATLLLLDTLLQQDKHDELLRRTEALLARKPPGAPEDALLYWAALAQHALGNPAAALDSTDRLRAAMPNSEYAAPALRLRGQCFLAMNDTARAIEMFEAFAIAHPDAPQADDNLLELGKTLLAAGQTNRASHAFTTLVDQADTSAVTWEAHFWLAQEFMLERRWREAAELLQKLVRREDIADDLRGRAWLVLAEANEQRGNIPEAIAAFEQGMQTVRDAVINRRAGLRLGRLLLAEGQIDRGAELLTTLIAEAPDDPEAHAMQLTLAEALLEHNQPADAVAAFQHYLESFTHRVGLAQAHEGKGWGLLAMDHNAEAAVEFRKAHELFAREADRARCLFKAADAHFANGDYEAARETYTRFLDAFDDSSLVPNALFQLGESWAQAGHPERADEAFRRLVEHFPEQPLAEEALLRMAQLKAEAQRLVEAIEGFNALMTRYTNSAFYAEALHGVGMARYRLFRFRDALKDFETLRETYPQSPLAEQALYRRALCHYGLGEDEQAVRLCREFLESYPDSAWAPQVLFWLGKYHFNHDHFQPAEENLVTFAERYPEHELADDALLWTGVAATRRNEYVRAVEVLNRLVKEYPERETIPEARFAQANALSHLARSSAAILIFDEIITKYPDHELVPAAWGRKGDNQFTLGVEDPQRYTESIDSYRMVANDARAAPDLVLQAEYKIGRSLEKLGRTDEAFEHYYLQVIVRYLNERKKGIWHNENAKYWFRRAAFDAADIMAARNDWRRVVSILRRVVESGVPGSELAQERIDNIRTEKWWLFY